MIKRILVFNIVIILFSIKVIAQGNLLIAPTRVLFENDNQSEEITLVNTGKDSSTYSISFLQYNMTETGGFVTPEKSDTGNMFADPYLRIFPRKVTIPPNESQVIRLQFHKKSNMKDGEYRSHLYFRSEQNYDPRGEQRLKDSTKMAVKLTPIFGLSIPIIIRIGKLNAQSTFGNIQMERSEDSIPIIKLGINRVGNKSIYGDILVKYEPVDGPSIELGEMKGVGVYTNINRRNVTIKLLKAKGLKFNNGKITVKYINNEGEKGTIIAEQKINF